MLQSPRKWLHRESASNLEVDQETVQFLLTGATVKVLTTRLQQDTDEPDTEQMLRRIQQQWICIYTPVT